MGVTMYEQAMRGEARRLIARHGELVEVRCVSGPPHYRIELSFADGHEEVITRHSGRVDITMMKFGYSGTGTDCFFAFLDEAGFKHISLQQLQAMEGPQVLRPEGRPEPAPAMPEPVLHPEAQPEPAPAPPEPVPPPRTQDELPFWADVARDPSLVDPRILQTLQKSMCFMLRDETGPVAALIIRASPDEFRGRLTSDTPMSLYLHFYQAAACGLYGVYPIVWDDPEQPQFKETWLVRAGRVTGPSDPLSEGQLSRLEALLSQEYTYFLLVDRSNRLVAARKVDYSLGTQRHFLSLLPGVRAARALTVSTTDIAAGAIEYMNRVSTQQVVATARRLRVAERVEEAQVERVYPRPRMAEPMEEEQAARLYPWQPKSLRNRSTLALAGVACFFLFACLAGQMFAQATVPITLGSRLATLLCVFGPPVALLYEALRPTPMREVVVSPAKGVIFRRRTGKEKPVIAQVTGVQGPGWSTLSPSAAVLEGRSPSGKKVRQRVTRSDLEPGQFQRFLDDVRTLIGPADLLRARSRGRRGCAWVANTIAAFFFVLCVLAARITAMDYEKGVSDETVTGGFIVAAMSFVLGLLTALASVLLAERRRWAAAFWVAVTLIALIAGWLWLRPVAESDVLSTALGVR